ncbi:hypothetical protein H0H81_004880 [Sphagnurus paluster]|uniref:Structure-specific endonuclease subunit SLX1 C-terminal domain-containing protein n=1 Tax=Sphagnurus paluster TaxID=117069 RepID=A0A9P7GKU4_9AGAR|nr:hypothetical protein H0H81_004880 [Sphagnurus paluster]
MMDTLSTTLCPAPSCNAVSHLLCLSNEFLKADTSATCVIPRGGTCPSCKTYTLWGDLIRGCYRRKAGGVTAEDDIPDVGQEEWYESDSEPGGNSSSSRSPKKKATTRMKKTSKTSQTRKMSLQTSASPSEGEFLDLDVSSTGDMPGTHRKRGHPPKILQPTKTRKISNTLTKRQRLAITQDLQTCCDSISSEGELFDSDTPSNPLSSKKPLTPRKRGRPPKMPIPASLQPLTAETVLPRRRGRPPKVCVQPKTVKVPRGRTKAEKRSYGTIASDTSGEFFDFDAMSDVSSEQEGEGVSVIPLLQHRRPTKGSSRQLVTTNGQGVDSPTPQYPRKQVSNLDDRIVYAMSSLSVCPRPPVPPRCIEVSD